MSEQNETKVGFVSNLQSRLRAMAIAVAGRSVYTIASSPILVKTLRPLARYQPNAHRRFQSLLATQRRVRHFAAPTNWNLEPDPIELAKWRETLANEVDRET